MASTSQTYSTSFPISPLYLLTKAKQQQAIADLQKNWHRLHDVDRAPAVEALIQSGISGRSLAKYLNCSDATIRRLRKTLQAIPEDRERARRGEISTNELARRAEANQAVCEARQREASERKRAGEAAKWSREILIWFKADNSRSGYAECILEEARKRVGTGETGDLRRKDFPKGMKLPEIIDSCRPKHTPDELFVSWFANWLLAWSYQVISDASIWWDSLDQAWKRVCSRFWMRDV
ncbi:MAG: hypothetical protein WBP63_13295 [Silvibacterium sp.]